MRNVFYKLGMGLISLFVLYFSVSIYLNGLVCQKYDAVSQEDINYVVLYSKIVIIYSLITFCSFLFSLFKSKT